MATPINLVDERGLVWAVLPADPAYKRLRRTRLKAPDLACWRDQMMRAFGAKGHKEAAEERLLVITGRCLAAAAGDDALVDSLVHAAKAFITLHEYAHTDPAT